MGQAKYTSNTNQNENSVITWQITPLAEIAKRSFQFAIHPEPPLTSWLESDQECPTIRVLGENNTVRVLRLTISNASCCKLIISRRTHIKIASFQDERDEVPCMVMMVLHGFALHEVMDAQGEQPEIQDPASGVWA